MLIFDGKSTSLGVNNLDTAQIYLDLLACHLEFLGVCELTCVHHCFLKSHATITSLVDEPGNGKSPYLVGRLWEAIYKRVIIHCQVNFPEGIWLVA